MGHTIPEKAMFIRKTGEHFFGNHLSALAILIIRNESAGRSLEIHSFECVGTGWIPIKPQLWGLRLPNASDDDA